MKISQEWRGYPLRCWPNHQDDCERWDYEILIGGEWIEEEADETLQRYLTSRVK